MTKAIRTRLHISCDNTEYISLVYDNCALCLTVTDYDDNQTGAVLNQTAAQTLAKGLLAFANQDS